MRSLSYLALCASLLSQPALAETITLEAPVTSVKLFPDGGELTRAVSAELPAGAHELVLTGIALPVSDMIRWVDAGEGLTVSGMRVATARPPSASPEESDEVQAARARVREAEDALANVQGQLSRIEAVVDAAEAQEAALERMTGGELARTPEEVAQLMQLVGLEVQRLAEVKLEARAELFAQRDVLKDAEKALAEAEQDLAALVAPKREETVIVLDVSVEAAGLVSFDLVSLRGDARWKPAYIADVESDNGTLALTRIAQLTQATGEDWVDVQATYSTAPAFVNAHAGDIWPRTRRVFERVEPEFRSMDAAEGVMAASEPMMIEMAASGVVEARVGQSVEFTSPSPLSLRSAADLTEIAIGSAALEATLFAKAIPEREEVAFLAAEFENTSGAPLPAGQVTVRLDGAFNGMAQLPTLAEGQSRELDLGPIYGLTVERQGPRVLESESGLISRKNVETTTRNYTVENLTDQPWDLRLRDPLYASEQQILEVRNTATPEPETWDLEGEPGIAEWRFTLEAGATQAITVEQVLSWPEEQEITPR